MNDLKLTGHDLVGDGLYLLRFECPPSLLQQYSTPGQYAIIRTSPEQERPAFFAIASSPSDTYVELLIKQSPGSAEHLIGMKKEQTVECQAIQGPGFSLDCSASSPDIHMFSMGSGYAPFRALIRSIAERKERCKLHLWQAAFRLSSVPLLDEMVAFEKDGLISLHLCLDEQTEDTALPFFSGQVQQALENFGEDLKDSRLLWIGSHTFVESLKAALQSIGVDPDRLVTNY